MNEGIQSFIYFCLSILQLKNHEYYILVFSKISYASEVWAVYTATRVTN